MNTLTITSENGESTLPRLDDDGRAVLFTNARTVNNFSDRPVPGKQLSEIYGLMKWGPTWANTEPLRILYITTTEGKARLLPHLDLGNTTKANSAPVNAILAAGPLGGFSPEGVDAEFFPDGDWKSFLIVNVGLPGKNPWFDRLPRLDYDEAVRHT